MLGSFLAGGLAAVVLTSVLVLTRRSLRQTLFALALLGLLGLLAGLPELIGTNMCAIGANLTRNCLTPEAPLVPAVLGLGAGLPLVAASVLGLYDAAQRRRWPWVGLFAVLSAVGWGAAVWAGLANPSAMIIVGSNIADLRPFFAPFGEALLIYDVTGASLIGALLLYSLRALRPAPLPPAPESA